MSSATLGLALALAQWGGDRRGDFLDDPAAVFAHYCAPCHGETRSGPGRFWASDLSPPPRNLDEPIPRERIRATIENGSGLCPPWGRTLTQRRIEDLSAHVAKLGGGDAGPAAPVPSDYRYERPGIPVLVLVVLAAEVGLLAWFFARWRRGRSAPRV